MFKWNREDANFGAAAADGLRCSRLSDKFLFHLSVWEGACLYLL